MISGNDDRSDAGLLRSLYRVKDFRARRIDHPQETDKYEFSLQLVAIAM